MKMTRILLCILSLFVFGNVWTPKTVWAAECSEENIESAMQNINTNLVKNTDAAITSLKNYNNAANAYISQCNKTISKGTPSGIGGALISAATEVKVDYATTLSDPNLFQYTNVNWTGENPQSPTCKDLLQKAKTAAADQKQKLALAKQTMALKYNQSAFATNGQCVCAENVNEAECSALIDEANEQEAEKPEECEHLTTYLAEMSVCILCPIFEVILSADADLAGLAWKTLASNLQKVIGVFFGVYLAIESLKQVGNVAGAGIGSYLRTILGLGLKAAIAVLLLSNPKDIYGLFISPVIQGGLDMGIALLGIGDPSTQSCIASGSSFSPTSGGDTLDGGILGSVLKTIDCFGQSAAIMPAVGRGLICNGWHNEGHFIPDFNMWFVGLILYIFGMAIWMVLSFYLIDCTVQLGILCALVPVLIACWPFKVTQQYSYKGVGLLMNTFFNFVMMAVVMLFGMKITAFAAGSPSGNFQDFTRAANDNDIEKLKELASLDGLSILVLIACCIFSFKLIGKASTIADKFSKGSGSSIGAKMGGAAASAMASGAKAAGHIAAKTTTTVGGAVADKTGLTAAANKAQTAVAGGILKGASKAGKLVGLGKYQPQSINPKGQSAGKDNKGDDKGGKNNENGGANNGANGGANNGANGGANNGANGGANNGANGGANNGANGGANNGANGGANNGANGGANNGANGGANNGANGNTNNGNPSGNNGNPNSGENTPNGGGINDEQFWLEHHKSIMDYKKTDEGAKQTDEAIDSGLSYKDKLANPNISYADKLQAAEKFHKAISAYTDGEIQHHKNHLSPTALKRAQSEGLLDNKWSKMTAKQMLDNDLQQLSESKK